MSPCRALDPVFLSILPSLFKELLCKFNGDGGYVIRVDHPSDIAVIRGDDPAVSLIMQFGRKGNKSRLCSGKMLAIKYTWRRTIPRQSSGR
jgi:hypothetical protein